MASRKSRHHVDVFYLAGPQTLLTDSLHKAQVLGLLIQKQTSLTSTFEKHKLLNSTLCGLIGLLTIPCKP